MKRLLCLLPCLLASASWSSADTLIGTVVQPGGAPVVGANIDVFESNNGNEITLTNDGTAADGTFAVTVPAGTYDVVIHAPAPPASQLVSQRIDGVTVAGVANLGTRVLPQGVILSGRVLRPGGLPAANQKLELESTSSGALVVLTNKSTNALGEFQTTAQPGSYELRILTDRVAPIAAPKELPVSFGASVHLGDILLETGYLVSAIIVNASGLPVAEADLDARQSTTGVKMFTPGDNTNALGLAEIVLPAGTYDLEVCADNVARLATLQILGVAVNGPVALGTRTMAAGVLLAGTVTVGGSPRADLDLDVYVAGTATQVPVCNDNTNAQGAYAVVVPPGTYDLEFRDVQDQCGVSRILTHVAVLVDTNQPVNLDGDSIGCHYCEESQPNSTGFPAHISANGSRSVALNQVTLHVEDLPANQFGLFLASQTQGFLAFPGGSQGHLCLGGAIGRYNQVHEIVHSGAAGRFALTLDLNQTPRPTGGPTAVLAGQTWRFQAWYRDQNPSNASNFSNALAIPFQ